MDEGITTKVEGSSAKTTAAGFSTLIFCPVSWLAIIRRSHKT